VFVAHRVDLHVVFSLVVCERDEFLLAFVFDAEYVLLEVFVNFLNYLVLLGLHFELEGAHEGLIAIGCFFGGVGLGWFVWRF